MAKRKYAQLGEIIKINKQWHKMSGLHGRKEWSAAMLRAATACEIAANFAIRQEFKSRSKFNRTFVNKLLRWANGVDGKLTRLLIPLHHGRKHAVKIASLKQLSDEINFNRNLIVHAGHFMNTKEAKAYISKAKTFVETLVKIYRPAFALKDHESK